MRLGLKNLCVKSDNLGDLKCFLKVFDIVQNGGYSKIAQNYVIGFVDLGYIQGFQRYLICEIWTNGSKNMSKNAFLLLIAPPKGQRLPRLLGFLEKWS